MPHFRMIVTGNRILIGGEISAPDALASVRKQMRLPPIVAVPFQGIVDTGATHTVFSKKLLDQMGLVQTGVIQVATPSTGAGRISAAVYNAQLAFVPDGAVSYFYFPEIAVLGSDMTAMGADALIGMNVLRSFVFHMDGPANAITLSF